MITDEQREEILKRVQKLKKRKNIECLIEDYDEPNLEKYKKIKEYTEE